MASPSATTSSESQGAREVEQLKAQIEIQHAQWKRTEAELKITREDSASLHETVSKLKEDLDSLAIKHNKLLTETMATNKKYVEADQTARAFAQELDIKQRANNNLHDVINQKTKENNTLKDLNKQLMIQITDMRKETSALKASVSELKDAVQQQAATQLQNVMLKEDNTRMSEELDAAKHGMQFASKHQRSLSTELHDNEGIGHPGDAGEDEKEDEGKDLGERLHEASILEQELSEKFYQEAYDDPPIGEPETSKHPTNRDSGTQTDAIAIEPGVSQSLILPYKASETQTDTIAVETEEVQSLALPYRESATQTDAVAVEPMAQSIVTSPKLVTDPGPLGSSVGYLLCAWLAAILIAMIIYASAAKTKWLTANEATRLHVLMLQNERWIVPGHAKWVFVLENYLGLERSMLG